MMLQAQQAQQLQEPLMLDPVQAAVVALGQASNTPLHTSYNKQTTMTETYNNNRDRHQ